MTDDDYTLMTTESMALVLNEDGCCVRHPSVVLREVDENGDVFLKETCSKCQEEFATQQNALLKKRREIASQLQELQSTNGVSAPLDEEQADEDDEDDKSADSNAPAEATVPQTQLQQGEVLSLESLAAHMLHIQQMQDILMYQKDKEVSELKAKVEAQQKELTEKQIEIALLKERMGTQKNEMERELKLIKRAVAMDRERRNLPTQHTTQQQDIHIQQLHVHKIPSEEASGKTTLSSDAEASSGDRVVVVKGVSASGSGSASSDDKTPDANNTTTADTTTITMAGAIAASSSGEKSATLAAAVAEASKSKDVEDKVSIEPKERAKATQPEAKEEEGKLAKMVKTDETKEDPEKKIVPTREEEIQAAKQHRASRGNVNVKAMAATLDEKEKVEFVPDDGLHPAHFQPAPAVAAAAAKQQDEDSEWDIMYVPDNVVDTKPAAKLKKAPDEQDSIEEPPQKVPEANVKNIPEEMWQDDVVESEEEDEFDVSAPMASPGNVQPMKRKATPMPFKSKPGPLTTPKAPPEHANEKRKDPLEASMNSLKPPGGGGGGGGRLRPPSKTLPTVDDLPDHRGMGVGPVNEFNVDPDAPPMVPLEEQVTIGSEFNLSDRFTPNVVGPDDEGTIGMSTLGPTVASSTYGEDRVKVTEQLLLDPYGDKGIYTGQVLMSTGLPHGNGRMVYEDDGRTYDGDWRHGRWNGWGRATFSNGDAFEGFYKYDQRHGHGKYSWKDGRVYEGDFKEDKRHGVGRFNWPDGARYDGDFENGQRHGRGTYVFSDGGRYVGDWVNGRYEGYGECHWADGRVYKGEWKAGMADGEGVETYPDGRVRHSGKWSKDEPIRR